MAKLDAYLRSIEKFGAAGAVLTSGQAITLRFPGGDRNATQVTPHDQLVGLVREVAPPNVLDQIDQNRPARFEFESAGIRYAISVAPRPGAWQVSIEPAGAAAPPPGANIRATPPPGAMAAPAAAAIAASGAEAGDMLIERGQFDGGATAAPTTSGSTVLDQITRAARGARATDVFLASGAAPIHRVGGELTAAGTALDADALSRELGIVATAEARGAWSEHGAGVFAYADGGGRVRVTLGRDRRGPNASLRLLPDEPPPIDRLGVGRAGEWLGGRGLIVITGAAGAGKTVTLASLVRALGERPRRVVTLEEPIEVLQPAPAVSQRAVGEHVRSVRDGVRAALDEGADVIAIGTAVSADAAAGVLEAVLGGALVLVTVSAPSGGAALERLLSLVATDEREVARTLLTEALLGTIKPVVGRGGGRTLEVAGRSG